MNMPLAFIFTPGPMEIIILAIMGVLLFGKNLPNIAKSVGSSLTQLKASMKDIRKEVDDVTEVANDLTKDVRKDLTDMSDDIKDTIMK